MFLGNNFGCVLSKLTNTYVGKCKPSTIGQPTANSAFYPFGVDK